MLRFGIAALLFAAAPASAQPSPCSGVQCSGHGTCLEERQDPFCLCDDGYAADGLRCEAHPDPEPDAGALRSSSIGARIVRIASAEAGRRAPEVGRDLDEYPRTMQQYLKPGELWCTDFVAWVYRAAGVPFTGGYQGGWHLTNNYAVRAWFERHDRWVANGSPAWDTFQPRPGDYLRFHTSRFGHSAIVRYVAGDALYTVEGNARGGVVRLQRYPHYKQNRRIDGFGLVTQADPRRALLR